MDWQRLYEIALEQGGHFTVRQALREAKAGRPLLTHHLKAGLIERPLRGIYRLLRFPPGEHEDLMRIWLWSDKRGVFSHETALALHGLSDLLPARIHLTLPWAQRRRRLSPPAGLVLHHADLLPEERTWHGAIPLTTPERSLSDCAAAGVAQELLGQAISQARARGLIDTDPLSRRR